MSYEIPQQLQHKERILFGLTFSQLGWLAIWGGITLLVLFSEGDVVTRVALAFIPGTFGVLFVFFDITKWIVNLWRFFYFRKASIGSKKMQSVFGITKIEQGIVYAHKKKLSIIEVFPINFGVRTEQDKEGIITAFQKFLNSLDFPIQISINSTEIDLERYFSNLEKQATDKTRYKEFKDFIDKTVDQEKMRNRRFFIIIPEQTNLGVQTSVALERLKSLGLSPKRLEDHEILKFFTEFFREKHTKPDKTTNSLQYLLAPENIKDGADSLRISDKSLRIITATGYPRAVESGFLDKIISSGDDYDISIHIEPFSIESTMIILNKELQKQRADMYAEEIRNSINPSLEIKYKDTRKVLETLQKGKEKLFNVSLYIMCKGDDDNAIDLLAKKIESELHSLMMIPSTPLFQQVSAYKSVTPLACNSAGVKRNVTTSALSAFFPFTAPFLTMEEGGVMLGLNKNRVPYIKNVFGLSNANGVVLATSGAGKSYFTKLLIARQRLTGTKVIIIDPQNEYSGLIQKEGGEIINISKDSGNIINPLDLMGHDFIEKRLSLMDAFKIMFGELSEVQKSILDKAITEAYAKKGISIDGNNNTKPPLLKDLYKVLVQMDRKATSQEKLTYRALINRLYLYTHGVFGFLNQHSNIDFDNDLVCFTIGDMPKQVKPLVMFLILDYVYMKMKQDKERKLLVVDEAWSLLGHAEEAGYIFEIVKTARKHNLGLLLITQDVADLVNSKAGGAVLANSAYTFLLRQKPAVIDSVARTFHLSKTEKNYLLAATQGRGILILDNDHQELEVIASPEEHKIITTNPNEKTKTKNNTKVKRDAYINVNPEKLLHYGKNLNLDEKNYLTNHKFKAGKFIPIGKNTQEEVWVKQNEVESLMHTFLVQNIKEEVLKHTDKCETNITVGADIEFKDRKGRRIGIEVETGKQYLIKRGSLKQKFERYNEELDVLYIVLSSALFRVRYEKLLGTEVFLRQDIPSLMEKLFKDTIRRRKKR